MSHAPQSVSIMRLPISLPCPVPVVPGTPDTMRGDEPIPLEERTQYCAVDAFWLLGAQVVCDIHFRQACALLELDYDDVRREAADDFDYPASVILANWEEQERVPWRDRFRYPQDSVITTPPTTEGTHAAE